MKTPADLRRKGIIPNQELIEMVSEEVTGRLTGKIKRPLDEPIYQIAANKQAVLNSRR